MRKYVFNLETACVKSCVEYITSFIILHSSTTSSTTVAVNTLTIARDGVHENCTAYDTSTEP